MSSNLNENLHNFRTDFGEIFDVKKDYLDKEEFSNEPQESFEDKGDYLEKEKVVDEDVENANEGEELKSKCLIFIMCIVTV